MSKKPMLQISKLDAAKRQIETAIRLWFFSADPVSIHTLTAAAHQILHDIGKKRGMPTILHDLPGVNAKNRKKLRELIVRAENFLKHADRDPEDLLAFKPEATEIHLLDAVFAYERITGEVVPILSTFKAWMLIQNPGLADEATSKKLIQGLESSHRTYESMSKAEFFEIWLTQLSRLGVAKT